MGAQQAFQWAVSYPDFADRIVATSGTAKTYGHGIVRLEGQIAALTADPTFNGGDYTTPPKKGLEAFGMVWAAWLYSQEWWRRELWKTNAPPGTTLEQYMQTLPHELHSRRRRERPHPAGAHVGAARRRHDAGLRRRRREGAAVDQGSVPLHAVGDGSLLPGRRRALRGAVHVDGVARADSVAVGPPGRRRRESRRPQLPEPNDLGVSRRRIAKNSLRRSAHGDRSLAVIRGRS